MTVRVRRSLRAMVARLTWTMAAMCSVTAMAAVAVVCVGGFALAWPAAAASAAAEASRTASPSGTVAVAQLPAARPGPRPGKPDGSPTTAIQRAREEKLVAWLAREGDGETIDPQFTACWQCGTANLA